MKIDQILEESNLPEVTLNKNIYNAGEDEYKEARRARKQFRPKNKIEHNSTIRRGFQVYREVCSSCHQLGSMFKFTRLLDPYFTNFSVQEVKEIASDYIVEDFDSKGQLIERKAEITDSVPNPYINEQSARAANGGAYPPNLGEFREARRTDDFDYFVALLLGYKDAPENIKLDAGVYYNTVMTGYKIKMSQPLYDNIVKYEDGTEASIIRMAYDITYFMINSYEYILWDSSRNFLNLAIAGTIGMFSLSKKKNK